ncbi:f-box domain protein [Colletotrichum incanum]|uniref:F-box domain protein n=1 Tax=Colletotrichum incanum TaxID=1573173 RepID=A0A167DBM0_COLIC|nr:f-box domain protein [Colletotrichum incanum]OHW90062.1 F-box domain-containing protein [Colletotrichum incanum]
MAKITHLPEELLQKVLAEFMNINRHVAYMVMPLFEVNADDLTTLKAASQTCRALHDVASPLIWKHLCLTRHDRPGYPTTPQLIALIRLWHERPQIAAHVHTLFLSGDLLPYGQQLIKDDDVAFISTVLQELGLPVSPWHETFNNLSFITALLVLMARNARVLDLCVGGDFFKCMPSPGETFVRLELLTRFRCHPTTGHSIADMDPLLRLAPNLKALGVWPAHLGYGDLDWSGITTLSLTNADISEAKIVEVIRSCRGLKEFTFSPDQTKAPNEIIAALSMHASTLRKLDLHFQAEYDDDLWVGSLAMFTSLEELSIYSGDMGKGGNCTLQTLPSSLKLLKINGYPYESCEEIKSLASQIQTGGYPNLKEVRLPVWECDSDHPGPCRGHYVDEDHGYESGIDEHGSDWEYLSGDEEEACDGGKTVHDLRAILLKAGVSCKIR